jgi:hypothetical protein
MPTTVTESDVFVASLQRPNNGELADTASILLYLQHLANTRRWIYNRSRTALYDITRAPYNADPTGATVSTTGIQAALDAAGAAGGHVFSPGGTFRHGGLTIPGGVSIFGVPDKTFWLHDHATANGLVFLDPADGNPSVIQDIRFLGNIVCAGTHVVNNASARVQFVRCAWNGIDSVGAPNNNLQGKIASIAAASSELTFIDCLIRVAGTLKGIHATAGKASVVRGKMIMPATYSDSLAYAELTGGISLEGVYVDLTGHVTGVGQALYAATNDASAFTSMRGCEVNATGATGTLTAFYWSPDANVVMLGNRLSTTGVAPFGANSAPSARSLVELREYVQQDFTTSAAIDLRNTYGYRTHLVRNDANTVSIILPAGVMDGQELDFIYASDGLITAGNLTFATTKITAAAVPTVGAGSVLTGHFRWVKREAVGDSDRWVQVGTWGVGTALV